MTPDRPHRGSGRQSLIAVLAAVSAAGAVVAGSVLLGGAAGADQPSPADPPDGAVISDADRQAVDSSPVVRGAPPSAPDPGVDFGEPESVARAYLGAAYAHTPGDPAGEGTVRTSLAGAGYAEPGSPPATVGVIDVEPPPPGSMRTASVTALELLGSNEVTARKAYLAELGTATGAPGADPVVALVQRHLVLARQPDGRWLVAADSPATPELLAGEDHDEGG